jgi:uridine kinase
VSLLWHPHEVADHPFLIGIAGPSCAGKTEVARALTGALPGRTVLVALDSYYRPLGHLPLEERELRNFDHPDALDWDLIVADVRKLARGEAIDQPVYLFDQHTRATWSMRIDPAEFIIIEGLFTLYDPRVRTELDASFFVNAPDETCFDRRRQRDIHERGRTLDSVCRQYAETVRPMAEQYVIPTREHAEVVLDGCAPLAESVAKVLAHLKGLNKAGHDPVHAIFRSTGER